LSPGAGALMAATRKLQTLLLVLPHT
jgi:hypothetical protein